MAWPVLPPRRLNVAELDDLAERRMSMLVKKTSDTYAPHTRKWKVRHCCQVAGVGQLLHWAVLPAVAEH